MSDNTREEARIALRLGSLFRQRRTQLGLSLDHVAKTCGFNKPTISRFENGQILKPGYAMVFGLAKFYKLSIDDLVGVGAASQPPGGDVLHTLVDSLLAVATPDELEAARTFLKLYLHSLDIPGNL